MKEIENNPPSNSNDKIDLNQKQVYFNEETTESIFTKADSEKDLMSNSVILENNKKLDLNKSLIDNLDENADNNNPNNKSQDNIPSQTGGLGMRSSTISNKKKSFDNKNSIISKKKKSIYFGAAENAVKIYVMGSAGKNMYGKMTNLVDKFQKQVSIQEPPTNNRKGTDPKAPKHSLSISPIKTNRGKSGVESTVRTQLPKHEMLKNTVDLKQKLEFEEAQRAAIIMRKLEYSKNTSLQKNKSIKQKDQKQKEIHSNPSNPKEDHDLNHNHNDQLHYKQRENEVCNDNLAALSGKNRFSQIEEEEENEVDCENQYDYGDSIENGYLIKNKVIKIQRWWRRKYEFISKIKFLQNRIRRYLFNKKYPKKFQKLNNKLLNLNYLFKRTEKKIAFKKFISRLNNRKDFLSKVVRIQRNFRLHSLLKKQKDQFKRKLGLLNRLLLKSSLKHHNLNLKLLNFFGEKKGPEINEFHEIKLNDPNKIKEIDKPVTNSIQKDKDSINVEMDIKSIKSVRSNKKELIVNSLENIDSALNNSNKSKKIVLKTSSRDFVNDENTENKLNKVSSNPKLKTSEEIIKTKLENVKAKRIKYVIDDEDVNSACYSRGCKCNIY